MASASAVAPKATRRPDGPVAAAFTGEGPGNRRCPSTRPSQEVARRPSSRVTVPSSAMPTTGSPRPSGTSWEVRRPGATRPVALPRAVHDVAVQYLVTRPRQTIQVLPGDQPIELTRIPRPPTRWTVRTSPESRSTTRIPLGIGTASDRGAGPDQA